MAESTSAGQVVFGPASDPLRPWSKETLVELGQKMCEWAESPEGQEALQKLSVEPSFAPRPGGIVPTYSLERGNLLQRLAALEAEVAGLREEVARLRSEDRLAALIRSVLEAAAGVDWNALLLDREDVPEGAPLFRLWEVLARLRQEQGP